MCQTADPAAHVRVIRCAHGTTFLTLGNVTLSLSDAELVLIDRAIHKLSQRHPLLQQALFAGLVANNREEVM